MLDAGIDVYYSKNKAFLTRGVDGCVLPAFITKVINMRTQALLYPRKTKLCVNVAIQREQATRQAEAVESAEAGVAQRLKQVRQYQEDLDAGHPASRRLTEVRKRIVLRSAKSLLDHGEFRESDADDLAQAAEEYFIGTEDEEEEAGTRNPEDRPTLEQEAAYSELLPPLPPWRTAA